MTSRFSSNIWPIFSSSVIFDNVFSILASNAMSFGMAGVLFWALFDDTKANNAKIVNKCFLIVLYYFLVKMLLRYDGYASVSSRTM